MNQFQGKDDMPKQLVNRLAVLLEERNQREQRRITIAEVAEATGLNINTIKSWKYNKVSRYPKAQIVAFCDYFDCPIGGPDGLLDIVESADE